MPVRWQGKQARSSAFDWVWTWIDLFGRNSQLGLTAVEERPLSGRVGVLGGTFDPVHVGHLLLAEQARDQLQLDHLLWIPAAIAPHPQLKRSTSMDHRLEMVRLATAGNPHFSVDDRELRRGGSSYTVETLGELHRAFPEVQWILLMGADSLDGFPKWRDPNRICQLAKVVVVVRGGMPPPDMGILERYLPKSPGTNQGNVGSTDHSPDVLDSPDSLDEHVLSMPECEISSSDIRNRVASGRSIRYMVPAAVEAYIQSHGLYRSGESDRPGDDKDKTV